MPDRGQRPIITLVAVLALAWSAPVAEACTTFCIRDQGRIVLGMNEDWSVPDGVLLVNKRGVARTAMVADDPARWTSRFGSVSLNQYGQDFPMAGMNEAGLVVVNLWLDETRYPERDERPAIGVLSWIQYQLDTSATVADVVASDERLRIASPVPLHYFVADRNGRAATIEFLDANMVVHTAGDLPVAALANSTYRASLAAFHTDPARRDTSSPGRFTTAARRVESYRSSGDLVGYAFETLHRVRQPNTQWSEVYEIDRGRLHYRTRSDRRIRTVDLADLDFSCAAPVVGIDLHADVTGDVASHLAPFTAERNLALIQTAYEKTHFLADTPDSQRRVAARHAARSRCVAPEAGVGVPAPNASAVASPAER